ncbi:MAG: UDP-N-acetylmuramate dehydrogenase [Chlamydiota bacterium]
MSIETRIEHFKALKDFSTFGIGGKARRFISIDTIEEMGEIRKYIAKEKIPFWILGKGSNSLFDDRGFDGLVILNRIDFIEFDRGKLHVGAGTSFALIGAKTARMGWSGLEFASGIPGSVGGAIYMNAGGGGTETCDRLTLVGCIDETGNYLEKMKDDLLFAYRTSSFQGWEMIIVSARFELEKGEGAREKQRKMIEYRTATQPYGEKSAGCIFRNPDHQGAGALIETCGLKGKRIGGAEVSVLHGNFIINRGDATARDVLDLATHVKEIVREKTGKELEMEICKIPYRLGEHV